MDRVLELGRLRRAVNAALEELKEGVGDSLIASAYDDKTLNAIKVGLNGSTTLSEMMGLSEFKVEQLDSRSWILFKDVENGKVEKLREHLKEGRSCNEEDEYGCSLLYRAALSHTTQSNEMVRLLIEYGADVHWVNIKDDRSLLFYCIKYRSIDAAGCIITKDVRCLQWVDKNRLGVLGCLIKDAFNPKDAWSAIQCALNIGVPLYPKSELRQGSIERASCHPLTIVLSEGVQAVKGHVIIPKSFGTWDDVVDLLLQHMSKVDESDKDIIQGDWMCFDVQNNLVSPREAKTRSLFYGIARAILPTADNVHYLLDCLIAKGYDSVWVLRLLQALEPWRDECAKANDTEKVISAEELRALRVSMIRYHVNRSVAEYAKGNTAMYDSLIEGFKQTGLYTEGFFFDVKLFDAYKQGMSELGRLLAYYVDRNIDAIEPIYVARQAVLNASWMFEQIKQTEASRFLRLVSLLLAHHVDYMKTDVAHKQALKEAFDAACERQKDKDIRVHWTRVLISRHANKALWEYYSSVDRAYVPFHQVIDRIQDEVRRILNVLYPRTSIYAAHAKTYKEAIEICLKKLPSSKEAVFASESMELRLVALLDHLKGFQKDDIQKNANYFERLMAALTEGKAACDNRAVAALDQAERIIWLRTFKDQDRVLIDLALQDWKRELVDYFVAKSGCLFNEAGESVEGLATEIYLVNRAVMNPLIGLGNPSRYVQYDEALQPCNRIQPKPFFEMLFETLEPEKMIDHLSESPLVLDRYYPDAGLAPEQVCESMGRWLKQFEPNGPLQSANEVAIAKAVSDFLKRYSDLKSQWKGEYLESFTGDYDRLTVALKLLAKIYQDPKRGSDDGLTQLQQRAWDEMTRLHVLYQAQIAEHLKDAIRNTLIEMGYLEKCSGELRQLSEPRILQPHDQHADAFMRFTFDRSDVPEIFRLRRTSPLGRHHRPWANAAETIQVVSGQANPNLDDPTGCMVS